MAKRWWMALFALVALGPVQVVAEEDKEPTLRFEMGGGGEFGFQGGQSFGPEVGLEKMIIEHWLELEATVSPHFSHGQAELGTELIFKKPFDITDRLEFEVGLGPEWIHRTDSDPDSVAGVVSTELIYAILPERHVSLFVEPSYSYDFGKGHEQAISVTAGLFIGIE